MPAASRRPGVPQPSSIPFPACPASGLGPTIPAMSEPGEPNLAKWPFLLSDAVMLALAGFVWAQGTRPMNLWQTAFVVVCVAGGACLAIMPFLLEYRVAAKLAEARELTTVVNQIRDLGQVASQISGATGRWQDVHLEAQKVAAAATAIADRMKADAQAFTVSMQRLNDSEKAALRLESEKMRRAETEWLQVVVRMLDHVYALHLGASRSGQPGLASQVTRFQNACRDAARRVGLVPFEPGSADRFDAERHQLLEGQQAEAGAAVVETLASGYTFQGRLLRPALVRVNNGNGSDTPAEASARVAPIEGAPPAVEPG